MLASRENPKTCRHLWREALVAGLDLGVLVVDMSILVISVEVQLQPVESEDHDAVASFVVVLFVSVADR